MEEHQEDYTHYEDNWGLGQHCSLSLPISLRGREVGCITFPDRKREGGLKAQKKTRKEKKMKRTIIKDGERKQLTEGKSMNGLTEKGRKKDSGSLCNDECVLVLCGIVGRSFDAEYQLRSCQQPYVMMLYPCRCH